jgi:hypothetical protein
VHLHQRWGKVHEESQDDDIRERTRGSATETQGFTRIVRRKNLTWKRDSIARVAYDPAHIPDCNVHATVGKHFLFHEPIPYAKNGHGYLRVTKSPLWWQQRKFPGVWTSEGSAQSNHRCQDIPAETVAQIQNAGCKAQRKSVIGAHNRCGKYLLSAISKHGEAKL